MQAELLALFLLFLVNGNSGQCPFGFMGDTCNRPCRDFYNSCNQWQTPEKCDQLRSQTDFFDVNCAATCDLCAVDESKSLTTTPLVPSLEPLKFLIGRWESSHSLPARYPTDHYDQFNNEVLDIAPAEVIMFGQPAINYTSYSRSLSDASDVRVMRGYMQIRPDTFPEEVTLLATSNEGLNTIEVGKLDNGVLVMNLTYMQIHPALDIKVVPIGASRLFRLDGGNLEMSVVKLDRQDRVSQFTKFFRKVESYDLF